MQEAISIAVGIGVDIGIAMDRGENLKREICRLEISNADTDCDPDYDPDSDTDSGIVRV